MVYRYWLVSKYIWSSEYIFQYEIDSLITHIKKKNAGSFHKKFYKKFRHACMIVFAAEISECPRGVTIFTPACTLTLLPPSQLAPHYVGVCFSRKYWLCTCWNLQVARSCSCQSVPIYIQYPWKLISNFMAPTLLLLLGFKDLGTNVFRTLMYNVGKPWSKQAFVL